MSVALRTITRLQDADDINVSLGVGVDEYALCWDNDTAKFVLRAPAAPFAGILATGATVGATEQAQTFTVGVTVGSVATPATLLQVAETSTASPRGIMSSQHSTGVDGARFHMRKSRGTNATPTVITTGDVLGRLVASGYDGANYLEMGGIDIVSAGTVASTRVPTEIRFLTATDAAPSVLTQRMVIDKAGNVGINTTSPVTALHVVGAATITAGIRPAADSTTALQLQNAAGTSVLNVDTTNSRVGIGTTAPSARLHVSDGTPCAASLLSTDRIVLSYQTEAAGSAIIVASDTATHRPVFKAVRARGTLAAPTAVQLNDQIMSVGGSGYDGAATQLAALVEAYVDGSVSSGSVPMRLSFVTGASAGTRAERITIKNTGLVGIGTTSPATRLDIDAGALTMKEMTAPTGVADKAMLYTKDNGSGKTQLCCKLGNDVEIVIATQA